MNPGLDLVGRQIGAYRVEALIGAGGYSRVYKAVDDNVGRQAAIKMLLPSQGEMHYSEAVIRRFEREARIVANLRDPHSVQLYEYGQTDDGMLYMIFEFIEGHTLEELRRGEGAISALRVAKILEQVLLSLEEAHMMGLVHRDIKPANIMLFEHIGRKDQVKVLDFGVGKFVEPDSNAHDITQTGMLIGTPRYMAPEQWSSDGEITPQTDIYSLGLVIYELLTGERKITASEPVHIMKEHIDDKPFLLPTGLDIPSGLRHVVNKMLEKSRQTRYASASDVLKDLTHLKPQATLSDTLETDASQLPNPTTALSPVQVRHIQNADRLTKPTQNFATESQRIEATRESPKQSRVALFSVLALGLLVASLGIYVGFFSPSTSSTPQENLADDAPTPIVQQNAPPKPAAPIFIDAQKNGLTGLKEPGKSVEDENLDAPPQPTTVAAQKPPETEKSEARAPIIAPIIADSPEKPPAAEPAPKAAEPAKPSASSKPRTRTSAARKAPKNDEKAPALNLYPADLE